MFVLLACTTFVLSTCKKKDKTEDATIDSYAGTWSVTGNCTSYTMKITESGSTLTFTKLKNCFTITASVSGNNLTIPSQTVSASTSSCGFPYTISGSGTLSGTNLNTLQLTYTITDNGGSSTSCSSTCTK